MSGKVKRYTSDDIDVTYDAKRCIHAAACVRGLPVVFDTEKRPWVQPANASADAVAAVVVRCPTGALHYARKDGGAAESIPAHNQIRIAADGPLYVHGDVEIEMGETAMTDTRVALCRCGLSANKPFCDNSHQESSFSDAGQIDETDESGVVTGGRLAISPAQNGPLLLNGRFELVSADGETVFRGKKAALCRCGQSSNKPFCDGTHNKIGFNTEAIS